MASFTHHRSFVCISLTAALLGGQLAACTSWRTQNTPPEQFTVPHGARPVRIVRRDGTELTLNEPRVIGNALVGTLPTTNSKADTVVTIPLNDVRTIAVREADATKTVGLVLAVAVGLAGAALALFVIECARIGCSA